MAKIQLSNEGQRLNPGSPVSIASSNDARIVGDAITGFGKQVENFARVSEAFDAKAKQEEDRISLQNASDKMRSELYKDSLKAQDTYANNPLSDGTDIYGAYIEQSNEKVNALADTLSPDVKDNFLAQANHWKQAHAEQLAALQRKRRLEVMGRKINDSVDIGISMARDNPAFRDQALLESENFIHSIGDEIVPADKKEAYLAALPRRINEAVIEGHKDRGEFDQAREFLKANPIGYDKVQLEAAFDSITKAEEKKIAQDWREQQHAKVLANDTKKKTFEANRAAYMTIAVDEGADPVKRAEALQTINKLGAQGLMSPTDVRLANSIGSKVDKKTSEAARYSLLNQVYSDADPGSVEQGLNKALEDKQISTKDAEYVLKKLKSPNSAEMQMVKNGAKTIDNIFKPNAIDRGTNGPELELRRGQAKELYQKKVGSGISPDKAVTEVLAEMKRPDLAGRSLGIDPEAMASVDKIGVTMQVLLKQHEAALAEGKQKDAKDIERKLGILNQQKIILQHEEELKKSGSKK